MIITIYITSIIAIALYLYLRLPMFGALPHGDHLEKIKKSPNYYQGKFRNIHRRSLITMPFSFWKNIYYLFIKAPPANFPKIKLPSVKTDLKALNKHEETIIWFGHSSYFIQIAGKKILVDPLFSDTSSPILIWPKNFDHTNNYNFMDIPNIDYLIITHDHWDHLDHKTLIKLKEKIGTVICGLGVGVHLTRWGIENIIELDWNENIKLESMTMFCLPTQHFSGRGLIRNKTLWASFLMMTSDFKIYIGGDSGYGPHFAQIGEMFDKIDLAILENGQYNRNWQHMHMFPHETLKAAQDLKAVALLPVHNSKISLSTHSWNDPLQQIYEMGKNSKINLLIPKIGEKNDLRNINPSLFKWWEDG